jgi:hypothetical protein
MNGLSKLRSSSKISSSEDGNPLDDTVIDWPPFEPLRTNRNRVENSAASNSPGAPTEEEEEDWGALGRS